MIHLRIWFNLFLTTSVRIGSPEMEPSPSEAFKMVLSPPVIFDQARASPKSPKITGPIEAGGIDLVPPIAVTLPNIV